MRARVCVRVCLSTHVACSCAYARSRARVLLRALRGALLRVPRGAALRRTVLRRSRAVLVGDRRRCFGLGAHLAIGGHVGAADSRKHTNSTSERANRTNDSANKNSKSRKTDNTG